MDFGKPILQRVGGLFHKGGFKLLEKKNSLTGAGVTVEAGGPVCPKCGKRSLFRDQLSDGRVELICLNLDCDYLDVVSELDAQERVADEFVDRVQRLGESQLRKMQENLVKTSDFLRGRSKRLARQQLAMVQAELNRRVVLPAGEEDCRTERVKTTLRGNPKIPPQFNTPQAAARRLEGIRNYHHRRKAEWIKSHPLAPGQSSSVPMSLAGIKSSHWLDRLLKTLREEALRHEQAARNYSRVPELFPLHIEHQARAFELNRVLDLLDDYADIMEEQPPEVFV